MHSIQKPLLILVIISLCIGCGRPPEEQESPPAVINPSLSFQPNILWLVAEDLSPYLPMFGDSTIAPPHL
ncbi:MAG: hypothetical protein AAGA85_08910, partial [Bacteroidota bacterium]